MTNIIAHELPQYPSSVALVRSREQTQDAPSAPATLETGDLITHTPNNHRVAKQAIATTFGASAAALTFAGVHHEVIRHWKAKDPRVAAASISAGSALLVLGIGYGLGYQVSEAAFNRWGSAPREVLSTAEEAARAQSKERFNNIRDNVALGTGGVAAVTAGPFAAYEFVTKVVDKEPNLNDGSFGGAYASSQQSKGDVGILMAIFIGAFAAGAAVGAVSATAARGCLQGVRQR